MRRPLIAIVVLAVGSMVLAAAVARAHLIPPDRYYEGYRGHAVAVQDAQARAQPYLDCDGATFERCALVAFETAEVFRGGQCTEEPFFTIPPNEMEGGRNTFGTKAGCDVVPIVITHATLIGAPPPCARGCSCQCEDCLPACVDAGAQSEHAIEWEVQ